MTDQQYQQKVKQIEQLISKVEDPDTLIPQADELTAKARGLLQECYDYLRGESEKIDTK